MTLDEAVDAADQIPGWMTPTELRWLGEQASTRKIIFEIGSWQGRSTKVLAAMTPGLVFAVDDLTGEADSPVPNLAERFQENAGNEVAVVTIREPSLVAATSFPANIADMVFIDGDHAYPAPMLDVRAWRRVLRDDGLLCGHDRYLEGVYRSLLELELEVETCESIWWVP